MTVSDDAIGFLGRWRSFDAVREIRIILESIRSEEKNPICHVVGVANGLGVVDVGGGGLRLDPGNG